MSGVVTRTQTLRTRVLPQFQVVGFFFGPESRTFSPVLTASCRTWKETKRRRPLHRVDMDSERISSLCDVTTGWFLKRVKAISLDVTNAAQYGTFELSSPLSTVAVDQQGLSLCTVGSFPRRQVPPLVKRERA